MRDLLIAPRVSGDHGDGAKAVKLRPPHIRWTVGLRLALAAAAIILSLSLFAYLSVRSSVEDLKRQVINRSLSTSTLVELRIREYLDETERQLNSFADIPAVRLGDEGVCDEVFRDLMFRFPRYANIFAARSDGTVISRALWESNLPDNLSNQLFFRNALRTGELAVSDRVVSKGSVGPAVHVAVPLKDYKGQVVGILGATLSLAQLQYNVTQIQATESACVIVADANNVTLLHPQLSEVIAGRSLHHLAAVRKALRGEDGYVDGEMLDANEGWLGVYRPIPRVSWALVVAYPESATMALVQQALLRNGLYLLIALLLILPALAFVFQRIVRELRRLSREVRALTNPGSDEAGARSGDEFSELRLGFISMAGQLVAMREGMAQKAEEMRKVLARQERIRDEERRRLALEVHDGVAQYVVCALQQARETQLSLGVSSTEAAVKLKAAQDLLDQAVAAMDNVIFSLRPPDLPDGGLLPALQGLLASLEESQGIRGVLSVSGAGPKLTKEVEKVVYRVVQEGLSNVRKHSGASAVTVSLRFSEKQLEVNIEDDGRGFDPSELARGSSNRVGISGMAERAASVGGTCKVKSVPGVGSCVELLLPLGRPRRKPRADDHGPGGRNDRPIKAVG